MFLDVFIFLLSIYLISTLSFLIFSMQFKFFPDYGWGISKPIGMVLIGSISWFLLYIKLFHLDFLLISIILFLLVILLFYLIWKNLRFYANIRNILKEILKVELVFIIFFSMTLILRGFDHNISGTEKPMDFMMINSIIFSGTNPPGDAWFGGQSISYYYFGYWIFACISIISGISNSIIYNLSIPFIVGMSASTIYSLYIYFFTKKNSFQNIFIGLSASILLLISSNLSMFWYLFDILNFLPDRFFDWYLGVDYPHIININLWRPDDHWWWWTASRVINTFNAQGIGLDYTIQEFPFFTILIGDLHPHFIATPFLITSIILIFSVYKQNFNRKSNMINNLPLLLLSSFFLLVVGFINYWDLAILFILLFLIIFLLWLRSNTNIIILITKFFIPTLITLFLSLLFFIGFYFFTSESQIEFPYILPVINQTRLIHFLTVWGVFLPPVFLLIYLHLRNLDNINKKLLFISFLPIVIPFVFRLMIILIFNEKFESFNFSNIVGVSNIIISIICITSLFLIFSNIYKTTNIHKSLLFIMIFCSFYLIYLAENFYLNDMFGNRMNTVFKFYYQAWILLSVVGAISIKMMFIRKKISKILSIPIICIFLFSLYFSFASVDSKISPYNNFSLDGMEFLKKNITSEYEVIEFLVESDTNNIIESYGPSYSDFSRISSFTGIPTILGWAPHEAQWRGDISSIEEKKLLVDKIYSIDNNYKNLEFLNNFRNFIIIIGPKERESYPNINIEIFDEISDRVFQNDQYILFKLK